GQRPAQREVRRLGDAVHADGGRAAQTADRGDDDHRAATALGHLRHHQIAEPDVALDVGAHDLVEGFVGQRRYRTVVWIDRGIADQDVDLAKVGVGAGNQRVDLVAA